MNDYIKRFDSLLESTMGNVKPLINEETEMTNSGWNTVFSELKAVQSPKTINWKDSSGQNTSLNWGSHKTGGYTWGLSIGNTTGVSFQSKDETELETFDTLTSENGFDVDNKYGGTLRLIDVDYDDPSDTDNVVKLIISTLNKLISKVK
jgi:hypothetical protein